MIDVTQRGLVWIPPFATSESSRRSARPRSSTASILAGHEGRILFSKPPFEDFDVPPGHRYVFRACRDCIPRITQKLDSLLGG